MATLFLINPTSGRKRQPAATAALIEQIYQRARRQVGVRILDFERLDAMLETAIEQGFTHIYAVGGDGTVNALGQRLMHLPVNFGVIPHGSGNGYARNLGVATDLPLAIRQSLDATAIKVDTGQFGEHIFLNVAGIGADAEVAYQFSLGQKRGFLPYARHSARELLRYQGQTYEVEIDGQRHVFEEVLGLTVANGTQWGYDARVAARASLTDGLLDLIVVQKFPFHQAAKVLSQLFKGKFDRSPYVQVFRARELLLRRDAPGNAQVDGEPIAAGAEIQVQVHPASLNLLLPNTLSAQKITSI